MTDQATSATAAEGRPFERRVRPPVFALVRVACPACGWTGRRREQEAQWWRGREVPTCPKCAYNPVRYERPNYATNEAGEAFSDAGADARERRALLDRTKPAYVYLTAGNVTGWKGNVLGTVVRSTFSRRAGFGHGLRYVTVRDVHGGMWHGKNSGRDGWGVTLYPNK